MRIARLILGRYGHLSDVELRFPPTPGLHVVLGENEAGKSTALAAIGDGLFGFPHRTPYAFLHNTRDLRIGLTLRSASGASATFFRRKGRRGDLFDETDQPVLETVLAPFLCGATRERFDRFFGLDAAELRLGGEAILKGEGEVGETILQAHTGLHGFRALVDRLDQDAARLFGDRRGRRDLHVAVDAFKAAREQLDKRAVEPASYRQAREERDQLERALAANALDARALHTERARLDRIRRTAPARRALLRALEERTTLGDVPALPPDAETVRQKAVATRERAALDLARVQQQDARLAADQAALVVDAGLLAEGEVIDRLAADQSRIASAERDRATQRIIADQCQRKAEDSGRRLRQVTDMATLATRIPDALSRDRASRASRTHGILSDRLAKAREDQTGAETALAEARAALALLPEPLPTADLRAAIESVKAEGRIDAERTEAGAGAVAARTALNDAIAQFPLWAQGADALAAAPVPLDAEVVRHATALRAAETTFDAARRDLVQRDARLAEIGAELSATTAAGEVPTQEAIRSIRERRDQGWRALRHHPMDDTRIPLEDAFEALLTEADALADRRMNEQERVVTFEQLRARQAREHALRVDADAALTAAQSTFDAETAAWTALWQPSGIRPLDPGAMQEWLHRRAAILSLRQRATEAERAAAMVVARHAAAWSRLAGLLPPDLLPASGKVADGLRAAERLCVEREAQDAAVARARAAIEASEAAVTRAQRMVARVEADLTKWRDEWRVAVAGLGLPDDMPAEDGEQALELWNHIDKDVRAWREACDRIEEMTGAIEAFLGEAAAVARRVAPDLADVAPHEAVRALCKRLADARDAARRHRELAAERSKLAAEVRELTGTVTAADTTLATLRSLAGAADDAALEAVIARVAVHRALSAQIAEREAELRPLDDGKSLAELEQEAEGIDADVLPGRIAEIDERLRLLNAEDLAHTGRLTEVRAVLRDMAQGRDAAGAAQAMQDALAEVDDIAGRYVRLRLGHMLLRVGIDRFRRQQQGPLLERAGQIFTRLTEGRYDRLGVDDQDDGKLAMVAFRPDGTECPADRLSEGTRDQLYLALRLAAIESYAARTEPLPFIADDLLVNFDDRRARAALRVLADFGQVTQTILFTHHAHIADLARDEAASLHRLPPEVVLAAD